MSDLTRMTAAAELAAAISSGETSSVEVTRAHLDRIEAVDPALHAFLSSTPRGAGPGQGSRRPPRRALRGQRRDLPELLGVPIAVKDIATTKGLVTTAGSRILEGWVPPYDATLVAKLRASRPADPRQDEHGRVRHGQLHRALRLRAHSQPVGPRAHPRWLGGGSAAAVAGYAAPLAIGTDTGGSIRQPGAVTGTVGMKPTYGGVSRYGLVALASSLDQAGPVTRTRAGRGSAARRDRRP